MALVVRDRVKETTTTTGTGTITLGGASSGFQSFSVIGNANTTYYCIAGQGTTEWEVGVGTYTSAGTTLSRDLVLESSNAGALVNFSAGTKDVFCTYAAERSVIGSEGMVYNSSTITANITIPTDMNAMSAGPITVNTGVTVTVPSGSVWTVV